MNFILFDGAYREALLPFTYTRPVADIRIGIMTIREKWENLLRATTTTVTEEYLTEKWPMVEAEKNTFILGSVLPTEHLVSITKDLKVGEAIYFEEELIAFCTKEDEEPDLSTYNSIN